MPVSLTYPGVYIQELSSGVHTITGVATSIAAFVGWAPKGPIDEATLVESWSEFQARFGGFDARSYLGYAVNHFFANGGQQAYIVRIAWDGTLTPAPGTAPTPCAAARAVGVGLATTSIGAKVGTVSASTTLTVGTPVLQSIAITPTNPPFLQVGQGLQLSVKGSYSDGSSKDLTTSAAWKSGAPAVATVNAGGLVMAVAAGSALMTATSGAVTASVTIPVSAATLTSIAVTPAAPSLAVGQGLQLSAKGSYSDGTTQDLTGIATWSSADGSKATVDAAGRVTAKGTGTTDIGAALAGVSGKVTLTVTAAALESIVVTPATAPKLKPGDQQQFAATGHFSNGTTQDLSNTATWTTTSSSVATVDATGLAKAVAIGNAVVTATSGAVSGTAALTVSSATLSSIAVSPSNPRLAKGRTQQLTAVGTYSDSTTLDLTANVTWSSGGAAVTVDSTGLATAAAQGTAQVQAKLGAVQGQNTITVEAPVLTKLDVTPANPAITGGQTQQFQATGTFSDSTTQDLTASAAWDSSAPAVAKVSGGLATAAAAGGSLTLFASNPGKWGNGLQVSIQPNPADPNRFSLLVLSGGQVVENFVNLSINPLDPQYVANVIENDSETLSLIDPATHLPVIPSAAPAATATPVSLGGGDDGAPLVPASDQNFELAMMATGGGVSLLDRVAIFNLLCVPGETDAPAISQLQKFCFDHRAFYIVDSPQTATPGKLQGSGPVGSTLGSITGSNSINSAYYFPWVQAPDPLFGNRPALYPPCGFVAGIFAATDSSRGVWKAPAGIDASLTGVAGLQHNMTDLENGDLNVQAINCLRQFRVYGNVVWGARTLQGNDHAGSEWKYVPIRRLALFLESSLYEGTQWVVFEPNDERLWGQIRLNIGAFMQGLFLQGAFQGTSPQQAYFVKCDAENNPQASINLGVVNILVGFAPLYPAEFVVIQIQQLAGQAVA